MGWLSATAFSTYSKYVGGDCGASSERAATDQIVRIGDCSKDIKGHLKTCGVSESALNLEARLLLAQAGKVQDYSIIYVTCSIKFHLSDDFCHYFQ